MSSSTIKSVLVIGPGGNVGRSTIKALLDEKFEVTGLTRQSSEAILPPGVKHIKSDYSEASLRDAFKVQDAVISTTSSIVPGDALTLQKSLVDSAISAGVKVFFPSEFGIDTSDRSASEYIPFLVDKIQTVDYLKAQQDKISWTAGLNIPGFGGLNVPAHTATVFDGGDISYEATSLDQVGRAIARSLKNPDLTKNQYVYVNSFTVTQNKVLSALERATNEKFTLSKDTVENLWQDGATKVKEGQLLGTLSMIAGSILGKGGLANYSKTKGLWNEILGLPQEDLDGFVGEYLAGGAV